MTTEFQPIETAPKTRTIIYLRDAHFLQRGYWDAEQNCWVGPDEGRRLQFAPTQWSPIEP